MDPVPPWWIYEMPQPASPNLPWFTGWPLGSLEAIVKPSSFCSSTLPVLPTHDIGSKSMLKFHGFDPPLPTDFLFGTSQQGDFWLERLSSHTGSRSSNLTQSRFNYPGKLVFRPARPLCRSLAHCWYCFGCRQPRQWERVTFYVDSKPVGRFSCC